MGVKAHLELAKHLKEKAEEAKRTCGYLSDDYNELTQQISESRLYATEEAWKALYKKYTPQPFFNRIWR
jgi:hypothetical protein